MLYVVTHQIYNKLEERYEEREEKWPQRVGGEI
jgi:hypothetical protein